MATVVLKGPDNQDHSFAGVNYLRLRDGGEDYESYYQPDGKVLLTDTAEQDVSQYAKAQVSDANLTAANIRKGKRILGVDGSFEGIVPSGKVFLTDKTEKDVSRYAKAQVSDPNLVAVNIAAGVTILGVTGTHVGGVVYAWDEESLTLTIMET